MFKGKREKVTSDRVMLGVIDRSSSATSIIWKTKQKNAHRSYREDLQYQGKKQG
jgi:hypothetical protein